MHVQSDRVGVGAGYGGPREWNGGFRDFSSDQYAPDAACVNTSKPFQVSTSFPVDDNGRLTGMHVTISQAGCSIPLRIDEYLFHTTDGMAKVSEAFQAGVTPVISYWSAKDMMWLDGPGLDGKGPCIKDVPEACVDSVKFMDFSITDISESRPPQAQPVIAAVRRLPQSDLER